MTNKEFIKNFVKNFLFFMIKRPRGWNSILYNSVMSHLKKSKNLMMPSHISIEPANTCNAACPVCETGKGEMSRERGRLDPQKFYKLIDEIYKTSNTLFFYFMGEPFLNKHAYEMILYARNKGIYVETCTNGDLVDPVKLLKSKINKISFQIGGLTQNIHQRYRVNSNIEKIKKNLEKLLHLRSKDNENPLHVELGFIVMRHNEHQVNDFISWAKNLKVDSYNIIKPCVRNLLEAHSYLPRNKNYWFYDENSFYKGLLKPKQIPNNECSWIWNSVQITWDGSVVPCCTDVNGQNVFGNVFENSLKNIWNGEKAVSFRNKIIKNQKKIGICELCSGYGIPNLKNTDKPVDFVS